VDLVLSYEAATNNETVAREWRRRILPDCRAQAQEAVAQLRARGIPIEVKGRGDWLVFDLEVPEARIGELLDRVWTGWRDCVSD
jgi:hypothetical protein